MDSIALELMTELHWSIEDFENADYYTMLRVFNQKADKEAKRQDPEDFFRSVMNPQQIKELEQRKLEVISN